MKALTVYFMLAIVVIELLPLLVVRQLHTPEKAKIIRFFTTLTVAALLLLFSSTIVLPNWPLSQTLWILGLLAYYGAFPFTRWLTDVSAHLPKLFMAAHFLLINGIPWLLASTAKIAPKTPTSLRIILMIHVIVLLVKVISNHEIAPKIRHAIVLLNGMLAGLVYAHQVAPFLAIIASECVLLWLIPKEKMP